VYSEVTTVGGGEVSLGSETPSSKEVKEIGLDFARSGIQQVFSFGSEAFVAQGEQDGATLGKSQG
tara:strand:- start:14 stop:208 length:195 start_codon:yes stop_codon:yes gene_type:complete